MATDGDAEAGVELCPLRLNLEFRDLSYAVPGAKGAAPKQVLRQVSGRFLSGRLAAVLGASGAGKTSLLNILSGFRTTGVTGRVTVNGRMRPWSDFRRISCYITQEFTMLDNLTVHESLELAARLKLGPGCDRNLVVNYILRLMNLQDSLNTRVKNLSGGEKKRLSIGVELVTNPPIMFFDEPTSGLDSISSVQMISHLKSLAGGGRTVICVVHQPSSRLFQMFDDLLIMSDGQCIYNGFISNMIETFEAAGFHYPMYYNPADFALEVACKERGQTIENLVNFYVQKNFSNETHEEKDVMELHDAKEETVNEETRMISNGEANHDSTAQNMAAVRKWYCSSPYPISRWRQFAILLQRSMRCTFRDTHLAYIRFITHVVVGLLLGTLYYGIGNDAAKVESNVACLFFFIMFLFFSNAVPTVHAFPLEASVFLREHLNNWYCLTSYYFAKLLSDIPLQVLCPTCFVVIAYFMTGQPYDHQRLYMFLLVCMLMTMIAQTLGLVAGAICNIQLGTFILAAVTIPMFLFSGFFMRLDDIPSYFVPLTYLSLFRYGFEAIVLCIYGFGRKNLVCSEIYCYYKDPSKFLENMGMAHSDYWMDICGLVTWLVILQLTLFVTLKIRLHKSR
ncbi:ATP-binding cassette sub-family G member 4 [Schistocerca nitens]|uniref:ATP-binding cassette sub-family G member 4 n=1 Tax=Schistocerca nitens TaxID=7011 RepID=UPI002117A61A|nr:ATP-binding cassette sub-family G member 4 [Schistocerca nitens]